MKVSKINTVTSANSYVSSIYNNQSSGYISKTNVNSDSDMLTFGKSQLKTETYLKEIHQIYVETELLFKRAIAILEKKQTHQLVSTIDGKIVVFKKYMQPKTLKGQESNKYVIEIMNLDKLVYNNSDRTICPKNFGNFDFDAADRWNKTSQHYLNEIIRQNSIKYKKLSLII